jgi:hypothetical protein
MITRRLAVAAYLVAFSLIIIPLFDASMSVMPMHPGAPQWRFGAVGLLSNALMIPLAGLLIAVGVAMTNGHRRTMTTLGILSWIGAALVLVSIAVFALDALQTRTAVRPQMRLSFTVASITAMFKLLLGTVVLGAFGRACRARNWDGPPEAKARKTPLLNRSVRGVPAPAVPGAE